MGANKKQGEVLKETCATVLPYANDVDDAILR